MPYVTPQAPTRQELNACIQCGLCLPTCPTYRLTGKEAASPRGRLLAMSLVLEGEIDVDTAFEDAMSFCLGCRACEVVCPGLVPYGRVLEGARAELAVQKRSVGKTLRRFVLGRLIRRRTLMAAVTRGLSLVQRLRLTRGLPGPLGAISGIRRLDPNRSSHIGLVVHPEGPPRGSVGLLAGCVMDQWFGAVHEATIGLLVQGGYTVVVPEPQTCCGALASHDGHVAEAKAMSETNEKAFEGCDLVVANAAGCSAHLKSHSERGADQIRDVTEIVAQLIADGFLPRLEKGRGSVAVQDPCHLRHAQRVVDAPRAILMAAGYVPVEIDEFGMCCGAAGIYSVMNSEASHRLGRQKAAQIEGSGATLVASANPGCEMQLRSHLRGPFRVAHPVELYWEALTEQAGQVPSTGVRKR